MFRFFVVMAIVISHALYAGTGPIVVGIAGGTGSGKTTLAKKIQESLAPNVVLIEEDCYYKDMSHLPLAEAGGLNFDHPNAIDFESLYRDVTALKQGRSVQKPIYDFKTHSRQAECTLITPANVIIVEGILIFTDKRMREACDLKIYVETDDDLRILRRIERDILERGRNFEVSKHQYLTTVKPMHEQYVGPSRQYADVIIPGNSDTSAVVDLVIGGLRSR